MQDSLTFDTEPIVAFLLGEPRAKPIGDLLQKIQNGDIKGRINIFNLTEVYYIVDRFNPRLAKQIRGYLHSYGLEVIPVGDNGLWREAALIKNKYLLSLGDSFAVATAQAFKSKLVIASDKELKNLDIPIIKIR